MRFRKVAVSRLGEVPEGSGAEVGEVPEGSGAEVRPGKNEETSYSWG